MAIIPLEEVLGQLEQPSQGRVRIPLSGVTREPDEEPGFFTTPLKRGGLSVASDFSALTGLATEALGLDETSQGLYQKAEEFAQARDILPRRVARVEDIESATDVGVFALESLLENAPLLATIAIPGGASAKVAGALGATARGRQIAGVTGAFLSDVGLQTGESTNIALGAGGDPTDIRVVGSGIGKAALDFVPILTVAKRIGLLKGLPLGRFFERSIGQEAVRRGFIRRAAGEGAIIASREIPTEVAQEIINISLERSFREFEGKLSEDEKSQLLNAAAGAAAFGLLGIPVAAVQGRTPTTEELNGAPSGNPDPPQLPGPESGGALPAPPDFTATAEGVVIPFGEEINDVVIDPTQGNLTNVAEGVREALGRTPARKKPDFYVTSDGIAVAKTPDRQELFVRSLISLPDPKTPTEMKAIQMEEAKQEALSTDVEEIPLPADRQTPQDSRISSLIGIRDELLGDENLRRQTDGMLTREGQRKVANLETRIAALSESLGIPNPTANAEVTITNAERDIEALNAQPQAPAYKRLSEAESIMLENLETKDLSEGLTINEEDLRERLLSKQRGERTATSRPMDAKEARELRKLGNRIGDEESAQVFLRAEEFQDRVLNGILHERGNVEGDLNEVRLKLGQVSVIQGRLESIGADLTNDASVQEGLSRDLLFKGLQIEFTDGTSPVTSERGPATPQKLLSQLRLLEAQVPALKAREAELTKKMMELSGRASKIIQNERFRRSTSRVNGVPVHEAQAAVQEIASRLQGGPKVIVTNSTDETLFATNSERRNRVQGNAKGAFFTDESDRIYIFADNNTSIDDVQRTYLHETLAHFGLRSYMNERELSALLTDVYKSQREAIINRFGVPENERDMLTSAEEYIAEIAENGTEQGFFARVVARVRAVLRRIAPNLKYTDNDIRGVLRDVGRFLKRGDSKVESTRFADALTSTEFLRTVGRAQVEGVMPELDSFSKVWGAKMAGMFLTPLQIAERFNVPGAREYVEQVQLWWARKQSLTREATEIANSWEKMPKKDAQKLSEFIFRVMEESYAQERRLTDVELVTMAKRLGMTEQGMTLFRRIDEEFQVMLGKLQSGLERTAIRTSFRGDPRARQLTEEMHALWKKDKNEFIQRATVELKNFDIAARLLEIDSEMETLRGRNYFPSMRFGQYAFTVRVKKDLEHGGKAYQAGEVVHFEAFESIEAREERAASLEKEFADGEKFEITPNLISDEEFAFLGMPPSLFNALSNPDGESGLDLSSEQQSTLKEFFYKYSPGRSFLRHLTRRKGTAGYSTDAMRVFATYMMNASNHIARVEFNEDMNVQLNALRENAKGRGGTDKTQAGVVRDYFMRHNQYIMNPENDFAKYRALGFLWYLGFNVKSAAVNLTQVPLVAYPFLGHHYGDKAAMGALMRSYSLVSKMRTGKAVLDAQADKHLQRAIDEGFVDESRATELAGLGESDVLQRMMPQDTNTRLINRFSYWGSWLFKHAEKYNREVVFLAARELALNQGKTQEEAFLAARKAVQATMFEYAKWNRPTFMRGKKSVFFLFWQYMQHLSFIAGGGEGKKVAMRTWIALMMGAGLQGLPFAENIFDLIDLGGTQINELFGKKDPRVAVRDDLRGLARTITDRPDLIMHGLSRYYGLGPLHLMSLFGAPIPQTDISGSLSAGRPIPGTEELLGGGRDPNAKFGRLMVDVLGPVGGIGYNLFQAMSSSDPDTWKVWERALPTAISAASKATRRSIRGEESFRGGGSVVEFDPHNVEQRAENIAQALGFATTRVNQRFELRASQENLKRYWVSRRAFVLENYAYAILSGDKEAIDGANKALRKFNKDAPAAGLRIDRKTLQKSLDQRYNKAALREAGIPPENAFVPLYKGLERNNPEGAPE